MSQTQNTSTSPKAGETILEIRDLKKYFPIRSGLLLRKTGEVKAVDGISFTLKKGQTLGLVGESGCGKSTLGRTIIKLYEPTGGEILFKGQNFGALRGGQLRSARKSIQMVFQDPYASLNPRHAVGHILSEPLRIHGMGNAAERKTRVEEIMRRVELNPTWINRYPHEFSGGQRQRISIARAIALNPDLLIADEPVSALDVSIQAQVLNLMKDLQETLGLTYVFISHDLGVIEHMCNEIGVMYLGKIVEMTSRDRLFENPLHPYTKALLNAVPRVGVGKSQSSRALTGEVPSPIKPPSGCHFHPRCPFAMDKCRVEAPPLAAPKTGATGTSEAQSGHKVACWLYE